MAAWIMSCTLAKAGTSLTCRALGHCQIVIIKIVCKHLLSPDLRVRARLPAVMQPVDMSVQEIRTS